MMIGLTTAEDVILRTAAIIIAAGGIVLALRAVYVHVLRPLRDFSEAQPTLIEIARQFRPNDGSSLRDRIDFISGRLGNIEQQLETLIVHEEDRRGDV